MLQYTGTGQWKYKNKEKGEEYKLFKGPLYANFPTGYWGGISFMHDLCNKGAGAGVEFGDLFHYFTREERN